MKLVTAMAALAFTMAPPAHALVFNQTTSTPVIDGTVSAGEWNQADSAPDQGGLAGSMYAMWRSNWLTYTGTFQFLLHNIEQNPNPYDAAYNVFDIYKPGESTNPYLQVWVFNSVDETNVTNDTTWTAASGLTALTGITSIVDTGFGVWNFELNEFRQYVSGPGPQGGSYDWDLFWGVYAAGGYDNSAYAEGLAGSVNNNNQLFEVVYRSSLTETVINPGDQTILPGSVRRSIKDPDDSPFLPPVVYWEGTIPEPGSLLLFGIGAAGLAGIRRRKTA
ncbi:MAG: PEP-CTERM sorting domain-containing protein [Pseudomonadota bacterium]|nr:PEP-CTERM sorting domain-containing protein [Pseudomonadota bacterium]